MMRNLLDGVQKGEKLPGFGVLNCQFVYIHSFSLLGIIV